MSEGSGSNRLVANDDASLGQKILDILQTHGIPKVGPESKCDHITRKSMAFEGPGLFGFAQADNDGFK